MILTLAACVAGAVSLVTAPRLLYVMHRSWAYGRPNLWQVVSHDPTKWTLADDRWVFAAEAAEYMRYGGRSALDEFLRRRLDIKPEQIWSVEYRLPHMAEGKPVEGKQVSFNEKNKVAVFIYDPVIPPPPPPEPVPAPASEHSDTAILAELYRQNPTAFWLAPDWDKAEKEKVPFWAVDSRPVEPAPKEDTNLALLWRIAKDWNDPNTRGTMLDYVAIGAPYKAFYVLPDEGVIELSGEQLRIIAKMQGHLQGGKCALANTNAIANSRV